MVINKKITGWTLGWSLPIWNVVEYPSPLPWKSLLKDDMLHVHVWSFCVKEHESKLQKSHRDEITSQLQANKLMIDAVKSQAEQQRVKDIEELTIQQENEQGWCEVKNACGEGF